MIIGEQNQMNTSTSNQSITKSVNDTLTQNIDKLVKNRVSVAEYDKTYEGIIIAVKFNSSTDVNSKDYNKYTVRFNAIDNDFIINDGKFHVIGEKVLVHLPNNNLSKKYIEVLKSSISHPQKVVYDDDEDTITETWSGSLSRTFIVTVENKGTSDEKVTKLTYPDGSEMLLEGF